MSITRDLNINLLAAAVWALGIQPLATQLATVTGLTWTQSFGWVGLASILAAIVFVAIRWSKLQIVGGYYGYGVDHYIDVSERLSGYVKRDRLKVSVTNHTLVGGNHDDPFPGKIKQLVVVYQLGGVRQVKVEPEGETMMIQRSA